MSELVQRVIGIDPGLRVTGYAVLEWQANQPAHARLQPRHASAVTLSSTVLGGMARSKVRIIEAGVIRVATSGTMEQRLLELRDSLREVLTERTPTMMAVEKLYAHYERSQPAILMGHARGVIMLSAAELDIPVVGYGATHVKKTIAGHGRAPKEQMQSAICLHLGLKAPPQPHDVADALAIGLCHIYSQPTHSR